MKPSQPFALIEKDGVVTTYSGKLVKFETLREMQEYYRRKVDRTLVFLNPYRTITERWNGYKAHGNEPILAIDVNEVKHTSKADFLAWLPDVHVQLEEILKPRLTHEEYAQIARAIIDTEIGWWNIAQAIFSQPFSGKIRDYRNEILLAIYWNLLKQKGQYMTFCFSDGEANDFVWATPEQHLCIEDDTVTMNPIAGTLKKVDANDPRPLRERLIDFLNDEKEKFELFQVLDEELKMMELLCDDGWYIEWPFLRQNGAVIHTEYRLVGKRKKWLDSIDALRKTLHAPTLVGSPAESAAEIIARYEWTSRWYYGGEIGILRPGGNLDTAICIRTARIQPDGTVTIQAGAGLKHDSNPAMEALECRAKMAGTQTAIVGNGDEYIDASQLIRDPEILAILASRNHHLSNFHLKEQTMDESQHCPTLQGKLVTVVNFRDDFSYTLARLIRSLGCHVNVVDYTSYMPSGEDILVFWWGPGDINSTDPKMEQLRQILHDRGQTPLLGICLGCQAICQNLGLPVRRLDTPLQGIQAQSGIFGWQLVGHYNSFAGFDDRPWCETVRKSDGSIDMIHCPEHRMLGVQFHPESVMTKNGREMLQGLLIQLIGKNK